MFIKVFVAAKSSQRSIYTDENGRWNNCKPWQGK
jgi:hypothetical protein